VNAAEALGVVAEQNDRELSEVREVMQLLKSRLDDSNPFVRAAAVKSIGTFAKKGDAYASALHDRLKDSDQGVQAAASAAIAFIEKTGESADG